MRVEIKNLENSKKELTVKLDESEVSPYLDKASFKLSKGLKIPGFRPGRVPFRILKEKIDQMKIYEEAAKILIPEFYVKALRAKKVEAIGRPQIGITRLVPGEGMNFKALTDVLPEVTLSAYKKIRVKREKVKVEKRDVDEELKNLQKKRAKFITKDRAAKKGDRVEIDFESFLGKVPLEGGKSQNHPLIIGESHFVKGFDEKLVGLKAGGEKEFALVFPQGHARKNLAGKKVNFKVKMKVVQERVLDEINDEFARNLGNFKDLEDLKKSLFEGILEERERQSKEKARLKLINLVVKEAEFSHIPDSLIEAELDKIVGEFKANLAGFGVDFKNYLQKIGKDELKFKEEMRPEAVKRIKQGLVLRKIAQKEGIEVTEKEVIAKINEILKRYASKEEVEKKIDLNQFKEYIRSILLNQKTVDFLENLMVK